jgi:death-on-curing protein
MVAPHAAIPYTTECSETLLDLPTVAPDIRAEYQRWVSLVGEADPPYAGPNTLGIHDVLKAHFLIADFFFAAGEGLGGLGPRDIQLLHSALYRQHVAFEGKQKWQTHYEIAANILYGLIKDHPFHDAKKRTAFLSTLYYLFTKGCVPTISQKHYEDFAVEIADDKLGKYARYVALAKKGDPDPEVGFIAYHLKTNTRKMDKRHYRITYNDLSRIMAPYGVTLENPSGNHIDVIKRETRKGLFGGTKTVEKRVCRIGFPGWTKQVREKDIKTIRKETDLTHDKGVDSQTFFKGVDSLGALIAEYEPALRRLAER